MAELCKACARGDLEAVEAEVRAGTDPGRLHGDGGGWAGIHLAAWNGHAHVVRHLVLRCGVGADDCDAFGWTALHFAACHGRELVARMLVDEFGAAADIQDEDGRTALDVALRFDKKSGDER